MWLPYNSCSFVDFYLRMCFNRDQENLATEEMYFRSFIYLPWAPFLSCFFLDPKGHIGKKALPCPNYVHISLEIWVTLKLFRPLRSSIGNFSNWFKHRPGSGYRKVRHRNLGALYLRKPEKRMPTPAINYWRWPTMLANRYYIHGWCWSMVEAREGEALLLIIDGGRRC